MATEASPSVPALVALSVPIRRRDKLFITGALLFFSALAWGDIIRRAGSMGVTTSDTMAMPPPPLLLQGALFLGMWTTMMVAMMFPSAAPMIYTFSAVYRSRREQGLAYVPIWIFLTGYLLVWAAVAIPGFAASRGLAAAAQAFPWLGAYGPLAMGAIISLAGLYQLSPLKYTCLSHCRTPLGFILHHWRDGYKGALHMGISHGGYCVGCCWLLFATMLAVGIMNLAWMGAVALLIFVEKLLPQGVLVGRLTGALLVVGGLVIAIAGL
ncbi:MAG: DUF2182 domain-containing protein [Chloroflexi bacterium]|nr:DUF2182 domain-containing protein [Chloroflexota bacterium]